MRFRPRSSPAQLTLPAVLFIGVGVCAGSPSALAAEGLQRATDAAARSRIEGTIVGMHAPRVFTLRETGGAGREVLVLAPRRLSGAVVGGQVTVEGTLRRLNEAELRREPEWTRLDDAIRMRFAGRPVLVASTVAAARGDRAAAPRNESGDPLPRDEAQIAPPSPLTFQERRPLLTVRAMTLVDNIDSFAGQELRIVHARVVGVLEPGAFLVEPATRYLKPMGERDRVLVVIDRGALRVPATLIVGATVQIVAVVRTLVGLQVDGNASWPARLDLRTVERLEVRAAALASSVQTAEGTELTDRPDARLSARP